MGAIKGIWSLRKTTHGDFHHYLVQSFSNETRIMAVQGGEGGTDLSPQGSACFSTQV